MVFFSNIAIPSRVSLWLGVILLVVAYTQKIFAFTVIGGFFIAVGCVLWVVFGNFKTLVAQIEIRMHRILQRTPFKHTQIFHNWEVRLEKSSPELFKKIEKKQKDNKKSSKALH